MSLPQANEPLELADGTKIDPSNGSVIRDKFVEVPTHTEAQKLVAKTRRTLAELPVAPKEMNAISVICMYTLLGVSDQEIALAIDTTVERVERTKMLDAYQEIETDIVKAILDHDTDNVRNYIQAHAHRAARKIVEIAQTEGGALGLAASKDILDRAGQRPIDVVEHRHSMDDTLRIEVVQRSEKDEIPSVIIDG